MADKMGKKHKNDRVNLTLSIDQNVIDEIKRDSERQGLSVNAKVNTIMTKYVSFYRLIEEQECSIIPSKLWGQMVDAIEEEKLLNLLNGEGVGAIYSIFLNNNIPMTLDNFIKYCFQEICLWSGMYSSFRVFNESGQVTLVFEHKYGPKWSRLISNTFTMMIRTMLNRKAESQVLPNTVKIIIQQK